MKTWLITGCSSGIGKGIAKAVLESGDQAIVTARNKDKVMDIVEAYPETALAISLDVDDYITSPTFTIVNEYEGRMPLYHFDVYRIGSSDEMYDIGYEEYINGEGVCIIEWANLIEDILPDEYLHIELKYKDMSREMILNPVGEKYEKIVEELTK